MSKAPEGLREVCHGFMIWSPDGSFDGLGAGLEDGEAYISLPLAQRIAEEAWREQYSLTGPDRRKLTWEQVPGLPRWKLLADHNSPVSARPQDTGWYVEGMRVLSDSDGLCHEISASGDCSLPLGHQPGIHDWER